MIRSIVLLALYLPVSPAHIISKPTSHYSDALKIKCDALPFRTVYFERTCYFVIDADTDILTTTKRCSSVLSDSKVAHGYVPAEVWSSLFVEKKLFISDAGSTGKTKAMCIFVNQFLSSTSVITSNAHGTTIHKGSNITARMMMPMLMKFPEPLEFGQTITIKGTFSPQENRPTFNLQQKADMETVALHFVTEFFRDASFIDTSRSRNQWDGTWRYASRPNPFKRGEPFHIRFRVHEDHFQVFVNEQVFENYKFVIPLATVTHLSVFGIGVVTHLSLGEKYKPIPYSSIMKRTTTIENPSARMMMPITMKFPEPLVVGQTITIKGFFSPQESRPTFNLQQTADMETVALHYVIEFGRDASFIDTLRSRNNWDGTWKYASKPNPFKRGGPFHIRFRVHEDHFQVFVNETEIDKYKFRIPLSTVTHLGVTGNGIVTFVQLGEKYEPLLNSSITDSATLTEKDQHTLSPAEEIFANGFPVCGKDSCSTRRMMYASNVSFADCKSLFISGSFVSRYIWHPARSDFYIDLKRKNGEIALRINARFDKKNIGLSSFKDQKWLEEETVTKFPFNEEKKFEIAITNEVYGFQIFVDGNYLASFKHRMCSFDIAEVEVSPNVADLGIQL